MNFWYRGTKPWISAAFRALRGIGGALERYHLIVQPFFCRPYVRANDDHGGMRVAAIPAIFWVKYCRERRMAQSVTLLGCGDVGPIHGPIDHYGSLVRDALLAADIRFAQVDIFRGAFIPRVWRLPTRRAPQNQSPINDIRGRAVLGRGFDPRPRAFSRTYRRIGASRVSERRRIGKGQIRQPM